MCVYSTARGPAVSIARPRRVPRPRATSRRPATHAHTPAASMVSCDVFSGARGRFGEELIEYFSSRECGGSVMHSREQSHR
eukprot:5630137-Prymnesium_polylepis.1